MNEKLAFHILIAVSVTVTVAIVLYNLVLRDSFAVYVWYDYPEAQSEARIQTSAEQPFESEWVASGMEVSPESPSAARRETSEETSAAAEVYEAAPQSVWEESAPQSVLEEASAEGYDAFYEEPGEDEYAVQFPLNLNEATYDELILIPRVGDVTAQRILQYRDELGEYENLEQLMDIKGIGEKTFAEIEPYLYVGDGW